MFNDNWVAHMLVNGRCTQCKQHYAGSGTVYYKSDGSRLLTPPAKSQPCGG